MGPVERWRQQVNAATVSEVDQLLATWQERLAGLEPGTREYEFTAGCIADIRRSLAIVETTPGPAEMIDKLVANMRFPNQSEVQHDE